MLNKPGVSNRKGFVSLISMIVSLLIICGLMYFIVTRYFKNSAGLLTSQPSSGSQQPASASNNYGTAADAARQKVNEINKQIQAHDKQMEGIYDR